MKTAHLIANTKSGRGVGETLPAVAQKICDELGYQLKIYGGTTPEQFEKQIDLAISHATEDNGVVIAAGGDGTIRRVAQKASGQPVRFAVVGIGTFNFFARNHRIPEDPEAALRLALTGECRPVRLGEMNSHVFLINASLGIYAKSIREREQSTKRFGRHRITVIISTMISLLKPQRLLDIQMTVNGQTKRLLTPMVFIGNNALQLRDLDLDVASCMKANLLAVVLLKPVAPLEMLGILFRGTTKTINNEKNVESFCASHITISSSRKSCEVALDGEMFHLQTPLTIAAKPNALTMVLPPQEHIGPKA